MKGLIAKIAFLLFSLVLTSVSANERYLLNSGDVLEISVWNEDTLQRELIILPDGMISFPLAGELQAKGLSVTEVQTNLKNKLTTYLADPVVTVSVKAVNGNSVHILGKVTRPGSIIMNQPLNVMQALSIAGGLTPYAKENSIKVLRQNNSAQQVFNVNYDSIKSDDNLGSNIMLQSGDVVIIP
jgi:polysaccharide export outer membrane protein